MPRPLLKVRSISAWPIFPRRAIRSKIGGTGQLPRSTTASIACRHHARQILDHSAAGDIREAANRKALEQLERHLGVDSRRPQQFVGERAAEFRDARD